MIDELKSTCDDLFLKDQSGEVLSVMSVLPEGPWEHVLLGQSAYWAKEALPTAASVSSTAMDHKA